MYYDLYGKPAEKKIGPEGLLGKDCILFNVQLGRYVELGDRNVLENVQMDDFSYTGQDCILQNVVIGKFANIAAHVRIGPTDHPMERPTLHHITYRQRMYDLAEKNDEPFLAKRCSRIAYIGHDTWIGHGAIIMPEVRIGNGAVVGSGAVVTKDVDPYTIVVGVPARPIKRRFDPEIAAALEAIAWWDWEYETIKARLDDLSGDVYTFIAKYGPEGQR